MRRLLTGLVLLVSVGALAGCDQCENGYKVKTEYKTVFWEDSWHENPKDTLLDGAVRVETYALRDARTLTLRCFKPSPDSNTAYYDLRYFIGIPLLKRVGQELEKTEAPQMVISLDGTPALTIKARAISHDDGISFLAGLTPSQVDKIAGAAQTIVVMPRQQGKSLDATVEFGIAKLADHLKPIKQACVNAGEPWESNSAAQTSTDIISKLSEDIQQDPKDATAYRLRSIAYAEREDYDSAIADLSRLIELGDPLANDYKRRADIYASQKKFEEAISDFTKALQINPDYAAAYAGRADALEYLDRFDDALQDYAKATEREPRNADSLFSLGMLKFYKGEFKDASADLIRAVGPNGDPYAILFRYLARAKLGESAEAELQANASTLKADEWPYAAVELYLGRRTPAATLEAAVQPNERCEAHFYIGEWHLLKGDRQEAQAALTQAVERCETTFAEYKAARAELERLKTKK